MEAHENYALPANVEGCDKLSGTGIMLNLFKGHTRSRYWDKCGDRVGDKNRKIANIS